MIELIYVETGEDERIAIGPEGADGIRLARKRLAIGEVGRVWRWTGEGFIIPAAHLDAVIAALVRLREGT